MLVFLSVLVILSVAYAQCREGLFTAAMMLINVVLAGIVAFDFWEPLATELESMFAGGGLAGYEDAISLTFLFALVLVILRLVTNKLIPNQSDFPGYVQQAGGGIFGALTGYLLGGFLVCVLQTLPWHENFLNFKPRADVEAPFRKLLPADRVWLAVMRQAGAQSLAWKDDREDADSPYDRNLTFDGAATFELRYLRYRRYGDKREPLKYQGELDRELRKNR